MAQQFADELLYGLCGIVTTSDGEVTPPLVTGFIRVDCECTYI